jgi:hypothetical protein
VDKLAHEALTAGQAADEPVAYEGTGIQLIQAALQRDEIRRYIGMFVLIGARYPTYSITVTFPAIIAFARGRQGEGRAQLRRLVDLPVHHDAAYLSMLTNASVWSSASLDDEVARWLLKCWEGVEDLAPTLGVPNCPLLFSSAYYVGILDTVLAEYDQAIEQLHRAIDLTRRLRAPYAEGICAIELARAHLLRDGAGDHEQAEEWLATAEEMASHHPIASLLRRISEVRHDPSVPDRYNAPDHEVETRPTLRSRAEHLVSTAVSGAVGRWVHERSDADIERRFGSARVQRAVFTALARAVTPESAGDLHGDLVVELTRDSGVATFAEPDTWTLEIDGGNTTARQGPSSASLLTLRLSIADFVRLLGGELGGWDALVSRRMRMEGDMAIAMRLEELFGGVLESTPNLTTD